mmetsp:Transcript_8248/g.23734  ORF Transcript_8248/g.23734 Transcript_8248/m.23734 type:complete len:496 (-) Transcript_8248:148-1635(-)|eukprot:CAMPEP_0119566810 /NCGR_PEP_ID=MMETSP1352-20130426/34148_1 /TAXON_ID=265584 /ORGANISM="Stauroneis constricta, Strain CCMP1120" /LENGTH=495 /DNA_ID=CAMNT_0007615979 /DNA_START=96 /DNA_END=1583 /DNA_ORIENTATION=+
MDDASDELETQFLCCHGKKMWSSSTAEATTTTKGVAHFINSNSNDAFIILNGHDEEHKQEQLLLQGTLLSATIIDTETNFQQDQGQDQCHQRSLCHRRDIDDKKFNKQQLQGQQQQRLPSSSFSSNGSVSIDIGYCLEGEEEDDDDDTISSNVICASLQEHDSSLPSLASIASPSPNKHINNDRRRSKSWQIDATNEFIEPEFDPNNSNGNSNEPRSSTIGLTILASNSPEIKALNFPRTPTFPSGTATSSSSSSFADAISFAAEVASSLPHNMKSSSLNSSHGSDFRIMTGGPVVRGPATAVKDRAKVAKQALDSRCDDILFGMGTKGASRHYRSFDSTRDGHEKGEAEDIDQRLLVESMKRHSLNDNHYATYSNQQQQYGQRRRSSEDHHHTTTNNKENRSPVLRKASSPNAKSKHRVSHHHRRSGGRRPRHHHSPCDHSCDGSSSCGSMHRRISHDALPSPAEINGGGSNKVLFSFADQDIRSPISMRTGFR